MVVELDPALKRSLYLELTRDGLTFKDWLTREAKRYVFEHRQQFLVFRESPPHAYDADSEAAGEP